MVEDDVTITEFQELAGKTIEKIQFVEDPQMPFRMLEVHFTDGTTLNVEPASTCAVVYRDLSKIEPVTLKDYGTFGEFRA